MLEKKNNSQTSTLTSSETQREEKAIKAINLLHTQQLPRKFPLRWTVIQ